MQLIIDTSSEKLKLILNNNGNVTESEQSNPKHLKHLLPEIDLLLEKSSKKLNDVNVFSVVLGPGSFTGVRIGVSTAKAFGCALKNKKFIGINMLELLAFSIIQNLKVKKDFYIIIKSTSTKFYFALCTQKGEVKTMKLVTAHELVNILDSNLEIYSYNFETEISNIKIKQVELVTDDYVKFSNLKEAKKQFVTLTELKPIYLALSQAEEELNKRLANENKNS